MFWRDRETNIPFWATIGYLIITSAIAFITARMRGGVREFFIAGGTLPWVLLVPFLMGEFIAAAATVGASELAHQTGVVAFWYFVGAPVGLTVLTLFLVKFYKAIGRITVGETLRLLFDRRSQLFLVITLLTTTMISRGMAYLALGSVLGPMLNISMESATWLSACIIVAIAMAGGLRGIAWMNVIHLVAMAVSFAIVAVASVNAVGGLGNLMASLPSEHLNLGRLGLPSTAAWVGGASLGRLISNIAVTAVFAAKDVKTAKIGLLSAGGFILFFAAFPILIGLSAYVVMPDIPSKLALWNMAEYCGMGLTTVISIGVTAAIISTTPGSTLASGALFTRDLFLTVRPGASERAQLIFSRIAILVVGFGPVFFALTNPTILALVAKLVQIRVIIVVVLLISVQWRRIHATAAFWTIALGIGTAFLWFFAGSPFGIEPLWPSFIVGLSALVIVSLKRRPSPFKGIEGLEI